jgi:hypothetical protein
VDAPVGYFGRMLPTRPAVVRNGLAIVTLALVAAGCSDSGPDQPGGAVTTNPEPTVAATTAPATGYSAAELDLCKKTDLKPLAGLGLTVSATDPKPPPSAPGAACLFTMKTTDGHEASLRVEASTPESVEKATQLYRTTSAITDMKQAGPVSGLGEEAEAYTKQADHGDKDSEYLVHARQENLVIKVWLSVDGAKFASKQSLEGPSKDIASATIALVPKG